MHTAFRYSFRFIFQHCQQMFDCFIVVFNFFYINMSTYSLQFRSDFSSIFHIFLRSYLILFQTDILCPDVEIGESLVLKVFNLRFLEHQCQYTFQMRPQILLQRNLSKMVLRLYGQSCVVYLVFWCIIVNYKIDQFFIHFCRSVSFY